MRDVRSYLPTRINAGWLLTGYTYHRLKTLIAERRVVLPICSLGTPVEALARMGPLVLPPLYHEALDESLKTSLLARVAECFPYFRGTRARRDHHGTLDVVELPARSWPAPEERAIVAFSVDTAVEQHGPHLPLMTDTLQSYAVLRQLACDRGDLGLAPPVEYGHLTWGLPFGLSIDVTPALLTRYVAGYMDAIRQWCKPKAIYVVDVHGSIVHREAICAGMEMSGCRAASFRWLHEPLVPVAGQRGDQHGGGVETALIEWTHPSLVDSDWWPKRLDELEQGETDMETAVELSGELSRFIALVERGNANGIVGKIRNYHNVDAQRMFHDMLTVARADVNRLRRY
ncbi:MAG: creatininase family protein [Planctomycetota bacterium]|jgi:creatinine amidohydrolase